MNNQKGQIGLTWIVGIGASIVVAFAGSMLTQSNIFNSKVEVVNNKIGVTQGDVRQLQTESIQYQKDIKEINNKLDKILYKLK